MLDPLIGAAHKQTAMKLDAVLKAAPVLKVHPDLAYHAANSPGNVSENAQQLAALKLLKVIVDTIKEHAASDPKYAEMAKQMLEASVHHIPAGQDV